MATKRIASVVAGDNADLMVVVSHLWIHPGDRVLDLTYGGGKFWTQTEPTRLTRFTGNFARFNKKFAGKFTVVVYDPPYVSIGGRDTQGATGKEMSRRYGMDLSKMSPEQNRILIDKGFGNAWRYLVPGGLLMVKCADYVSSGHYKQGYRSVVEMAAVRGMEQVDEFILVSGTGPQPLVRNGKPLKQVHSHRAHSALAIFQKDPSV